MEEALRPACTGADRVTAPCESVSVSTSARLHFGFLDPSGRGPTALRQLRARDRPAANAAELAARRRIQGVGRRVRTRRALSPRDCGKLRPRRCLSLASRRGDPGACRARLGHAACACHRLGACAVLEGLPLDLNGIAARLERGKRSGIGIGTFEQGGAVLDGGPGPRRAAAGARPRPLPARLARAA